MTNIDGIWVIKIDLPKETCQKLVCNV